MQPFMGNVEVLQLLLTSNRFPRESVNATNRWGGTALHTAAYAGHCSIVRALLESRRFDSVLATDNVGNTALHTAAVHAQADVVEALLSSLKFKRPGLANSQGQNALHHLCHERACGRSGDTLGIPCLS